MALLIVAQHGTFGSTRYKRGGDVTPLPAGLVDRRLPRRLDATPNTMFIDVDTTSRPVHVRD